MPPRLDLSTGKLNARSRLLNPSPVWFSCSDRTKCTILMDVGNKMHIKHYILHLTGMRGRLFYWCEVWGVFCIYISPKHSDTTCSLVRELKYMTDLACTVPLYCQLRPVCSWWFTTPGTSKSKPSNSLQLCERSQAAYSSSWSHPLPAATNDYCQFRSILPSIFSINCFTLSYSPTLHIQIAFFFRTNSPNLSDILFTII